MSSVDVLIPTYQRPHALAVTLTSLCAQQFRDFRVLISDQTKEQQPLKAEVVQSVLRVLETHGHHVEIFKHLPRQGMAEHRQFLLKQAKAPYVLFLDDDVICEPYVLDNLQAALRREQCGFVGAAVVGLSFRNDRRPEEQQVEFWNAPVEPEKVLPGTPAWDRWRLHNAANLYHVQQRLGIDPQEPRTYKVAWVGGCVLYDRKKLQAVGGFEFWSELPADHCGEDVLAQLRLMERCGGCALMPSGVYHQELPTTLPDREIAADNALNWGVKTNNNGR